MPIAVVSPAITIISRTRRAKSAACSSLISWFVLLITG